MRRLTIRLLAICLLGAGSSQIVTGAAHACIKFDRGAEIALIDEAIMSPATPDAKKAALKAYRIEMTALSSRTDGESIGKYGSAAKAALKLIGQDRIVWNGKAGKLDVGVFKDNSVPTLAARGNIPVATPACG